MVANLHPGKALSARLDAQFGPGVALIYFFAFVVVNFVTRYATLYLTTGKGLEIVQLFAEMLMLPVLAYAIGLVIWLVLRLFGKVRNVKVVVYSFFYAVFRTLPFVIVYNLLPIVSPSPIAQSVISTILALGSLWVIILAMRSGIAHDRALITAKANR